MCKHAAMAEILVAAAGSRGGMSSGEGTGEAGQGKALRNLVRIIVLYVLTLAEVADGVGDEAAAVILTDDVGGDDEHLAGAKVPRVLPDREQPVLPPRHQHQVRAPPRVLVRHLLRAQHE